MEGPEQTVLDGAALTQDHDLVHPLGGPPVRLIRIWRTLGQNRVDLSKCSWLTVPVFAKAKRPVSGPWSVGCPLSATAHDLSLEPREELRRPQVGACRGGYGGSVAPASPW